MASTRAEHLATIDSIGTDSVILEARRLDGGPYLDVGIPGALVVSLEDDLAGAGGGEAGRFPLPSSLDLAARLELWGIHDDSDVVIYAATAASVTAATRAWFVLRWAGLTRVRVLDGGIDAWPATSTPLVAHSTPPGGGTATVRPGSLPTIDADGAAATAAKGTLWDARDAEHFTGNSSKSGHIPGAQLQPGANLFDDVYLRSEEFIARALDCDPDAEIGAYCGGGVAATAIVFALATLGRRAPLYVASWSGWSSDATRPVAR